MRKKQSFEAQLTRLSLIASIPTLLLLLWVMLYANISIYLTLLVGFIGSILVIYCNYRIHEKSAYQFRSLSNLLEAMVQGDYSLRARSSVTSIGNASGGNDTGNRINSALDDLVESINRLAKRLSDQKLASIESQLLLQTVIDHIDVAIIALDSDNTIRLINPAARKLLQIEQRDSTTTLVQQLQSVQSFSSGHNQVLELSFGQQQGKFNVHVETYREGGEEQKLLFITDVSSLLRREERKAWQNLVRVISHEINNSLTPIASISQTLLSVVAAETSQQKGRADLLDGLKLISQRANNLSSFVNSYRQITRLPEPTLTQVDFKQLLQKVVGLFDDSNITMLSDVEVSFKCDSVQLEQVLINLLKNATEAMAEQSPLGTIAVDWQIDAGNFRFRIMDEGCGIKNPENLFVPFYTTKKSGTGIGLVLCRQIIEAHGGSLNLNNREDGLGSQAVIEIPIRH
ncbi:PAS domain-containing protein [Aliikangiella marina]|uniref:histidine kinase n=1 Tax=Aliikangiella marina TaxID=1712262 RepID=A0A545T505_9GAMM|nr:ATP-binding protein [Aliikangiella marina]TQV72311.1 PAS domain-containing protein [Aliikangiella marina]